MTKRLPTQGDNFGLLLIGLPMLALVAVWSVGELTLPIDQWALVKFAVPVCLLAYAVVWWLSFRNTKLILNVGLTSAFLLLLWLMAGAPFVGWFNAWNDDSPTLSIERRVLNTAQTRRACAAWLDKPIAEAWVVHLGRDACDGLRPPNDRLQIKARHGRLGMLWMSDYQVVRKE
ncbi:MAG: hypothetical protein ACK5UX_10080 [Burkholderiales bacterium]|jgi:hypothetical protein|nr:hypothetical protein [Nitrosomonadaceae bacterium]